MTVFQPVAEADEIQEIKEFIDDNNRNIDHQQDILVFEDGVCGYLAAGTHSSAGHLIKVVQRVVALEGNGQRPSHQGDGYAETDKSYTLNATEVHGVAYEVPQDVVLYQREFGGKATENPVASPTLEAAMGMGGNNQPIVSYAIDMGGGKSACDVIEDKSPTLCTTHYGEPAVVYDARGNGDGDTAPTMTGDHQNRITDYTGVVVQAFRKQGHPMSAEEGQGWEEADKSDTLNVFDNSESRTPTVVVSMDRETFNAGQNFASELGIHEDGIQPTLVAREPGGVCYTTYHGCFHMNPSENVANTLEASDYKDAPIVSYPELQDVTGSLMASGYDKLGTQEACNGMYVVGQYWDGSQVAGTLTVNNANGGQRMPDKDNFNCVIQGIDVYNQTETGDVSKPLTASATDSDHIPCVLEHKVRYIVRRLTPLECERLQGFPDSWTDIGDWTDSTGKTKKLADSNRYKALGNSIALPSWRWVLKRMSAQYERPCTMASLFDGISGFPWLWTQINGKDSVLWTSEIEEFPIAVCKKHFGDEATGEKGDYEKFLR